MFKKIFITLVVVSILTVFIGTAVFLYKKSQEKAVIYETTTPFYTDIVSKTVATGKIIPRKEIEIKPQVSGVIDQLFVEPGQILEKGALIARIQLIPNMEQLNRAESNLERSKLNFKNSEIEYERQKELFEDKLISEHEFNKFKLLYDIQNETVKEAENNLALIKEGASKGSGQVANLVRSTVTGMILDVPVKEGSFVIESNTFNAGTTIANVANMKELIFEGNLDESEIGKVSEGMPLTLDIGALDSEKFSAVLEYISPKGVDQQGTIKFKIRAALTLREGYFLRAGYSANANIILDKRSQVLAIDEGNLITEAGGTFVEMELSEQEFTKKDVEVGLSDGINIEIISGLKESSRIKKRVN